MSNEQAEREKIIEGLQPLFKEAEKKGLWFHCHYQDLLFSPAELRQAQSEGRFLWGAVNWTLVKPEERLDALEKAVDCAKADAAKFAKRMKTK